MRFRFLSYPLGARNPLYGGGSASPELKKLRDIKKGDSSNSYWFGLNNHWGTHVDAPAHFFERGKEIADYPAEFWRFGRPQALEVRLRPGQLLCRKDLEGKIKKTTDLLLFRSGWAKRRGEADYNSRNPGVHAEVGFWLRRCFPKMRAVGLDWLSLSSYQKREEGRAAHRAFLDPAGAGQPVLIIEDMDLSAPLGGLREAWVLPIRVENMDSAPCTVVGVF
ncbi:MAG: cyclase family protein [Candidatus Omnitrophica bacterium]|nr:cyclase family protein [Candidatus Omnitrophota bacterium]